MCEHICFAPVRRSPKLAAFVALAGPPGLLARYRAPLLTPKKSPTCIMRVPKLAPFLKDFPHTAKIVAR